jgi:hypothetical protein
MVHHLHSRMAPPPVRILEGIFGMLDHRVLVALCAAGVPDALSGKTDPASLADKVGVDPVALERLLRFAATRGWVRIDRRGRVGPTAVTAFLRRDHPGGWRAWVDFAGGDEIVAAVASLTIGAKPTDAFAAANGIPFFDWMSGHPDRWAVFDDAMAAGGRMHALTLDAALDWSASRRVCDVGGGYLGNCWLRCSSSNRISRVPCSTCLRSSTGRWSTSGSRPSAATRFAKCRAGSTPTCSSTCCTIGTTTTQARSSTVSRWRPPRDARIIVVDNERTVTPHNDLAVSADVLMAALTNGGRERTTSEFAALGRASGLHLAGTARLASGDVAHEFVTSRR